MLFHIKTLTALVVKNPLISDRKILGFYSGYQASVKKILQCTDSRHN